MPSLRSAAPALLALAALTLPAAAQAPTVVPTPALPFDPRTSLTAPIALMVDLGSGRTLFTRQANRRFMPASLTKIMTAYVAFELISAGKLHPAQRFTMSDAAFAQWHRVGSTMFLNRGQSVSVDELLRGIMTVSANDGCVVLAEGASGSVANFVALMNAEAKRLGMNDSRFGSPNGWPDQGATYTTAHDLAVVTRAILLRHPALYQAYVGHPEFTFNNIRQSNHVPIVGSVAGADGVKTGFTNEAGYGFVGSAVRNGRRLVMVVGGYDRAWQRARETRAIKEWGFYAWRTQPLLPRGATIGEVRVQGGAATTVPVDSPVPYYLTLAPDERAGQATARLRYFGPIQAPVAKGAQVAELVVSAPGQPPHALPLYAKSGVAPAGPLARLRNGLLGLVGL
jgi:D-alanyl-D-alanine carboxypeptidase (penicillin-binding protein 5/6)